MKYSVVTIIMVSETDYSNIIYFTTDYSNIIYFMNWALTLNRESIAACECGNSLEGAPEQLSESGQKGVFVVKICWSKKAGCRPSAQFASAKTNELPRYLGLATA